MTNHFQKWIQAQTQSVFGGIEKPRRGKKRFALLLALPFFFVPVLIAGFVVADVGDALSKRAVAFLQSREKLPPGTGRQVATQAKATGKRRNLVASKTE